MNKDLIDKFNECFGELDHLFQEGVIFSQSEKHSLDMIGHDILAIVNDAFFNVEGDNRTPVEKQNEKKREAVKTAQPLLDLVNYYGLAPKQMVEILGIIKRTCPSFSIK